MSTLPNDVFLNGVLHSVQTSELTKNAINPRNTFIDSGKTELDDISGEFAKHPFDPIKALQTQPESSEAKQSQSNYPTTQDSFTTDAFLSVSKTHLSRNSQTLSAEPASESEMFHDSLGGVQRFDDNMQSLHQKSFSENRQLVDEKTVADNFQKLAPTESRHDTILYKEKKNIHDNSQLVKVPGSGRSSATLSQTRQSENKPDLSVPPFHADHSIQTKLPSHSLLAEDKLRARVRKVKENIGKVNQSLTDIEEDK